MKKPKLPSYFVPPFEVKEKHGMIGVFNANDIAIGIYGNRQQADERAAELNKTYPSKKRKRSK